MKLVARAWINRFRRRMAHALLYRTVFGERFGGRWLPHSRISPSTCIEHEENLQLGDHVYIGVFNFIEASAGVVIGEGVQITHHVSIVTHSSHRAQRLLGRRYIDWEGPKPGWRSAPVIVGDYSFIGPHSVLEAGTQLGRGTIVRAGAVVRGVHPDFAVLDGRPARAVGDSREGDTEWLLRHPEVREHYDAWVEQRPSTLR